MGCGGNAGAQVEMPKTLTIHGHILNSTSRSLMCICDVANQNFVLNKIDTIKNQHKDIRYVGINPTCTIPMIEEGMFKVLGGNHVIYVFLCKNHTGIAQKLMPSELEQ